ncbi:18473_t:CDS:2, partial [Gigaspora rosea]
KKETTTAVAPRAAITATRNKPIRDEQKTEENIWEPRARSTESRKPTEPTDESISGYINLDYHGIANISGTEGSENTHSNTKQVTSIQYTQINSQEPICVTSTGSNVDQFE